jgi:hypothetical protein
MELVCCADEEPNDDATEPYFADNDDGPTDIDDESSTIIASSHGSSVANSNYIHFEVGSLRPLSRTLCTL